MQTTVVGSYPKIPNRPRPARLRAAIGRLDRGEITHEELARIQDEGTVEVIQEQVEAAGAVAWKSPVLVRDYRFALEHSEKPVKPIITGPYTLAALSLEGHY